MREGTEAFTHPEHSGERHCGPGTELGPGNRAVTNMDGEGLAGVGREAVEILFPPF